MRQLKISQSVTNRSSKAIEKYLADIAKIPMINQQREIELAVKIRDGDEAALQELVHANLRFVVSCAKQYQNRGIDLQDLINEGNVGLIKAARKFDETRGFKFISFAVWWIRQSILQAISDSGRMIRIPLNKIGLQNKFLKTFSKLEQTLGRLPSDSEIMEAMEINEKEMSDLLLAMNRVQSYDAEMSDDENSPKLIDILNPIDGDTNSPDEPLVFSESLKKDMERAITTLTEREKDVLRLFFGIGIPEPLSLDEIGQKFELTRERVRQVKEKALRRLRTHNRAALLRKYLN